MFKKKLIRKRKKCSQHFKFSAVACELTSSIYTARQSRGSPDCGQHDFPHTNTHHNSMNMAFQFSRDMRSLLTRALHKRLASTKVQITASARAFQATQEQSISSASRRRKRRSEEETSVQQEPVVRRSSSSYLLADFLFFFLHQV